MWWDDIFAILFLTLQQISEASHQIANALVALGPSIPGQMTKDLLHMLPLNYIPLVPFPFIFRHVFFRLFGFILIVTHQFLWQAEESMENLLRHRTAFNVMIFTYICYKIVHFVNLTYTHLLPLLIIRWLWKLHVSDDRCRYFGGDWMRSKFLVGAICCHPTVNSSKGCFTFSTKRFTMPVQLVFYL